MLTPMPSTTQAMLDVLHNAFPSLTEQALSDAYIQAHPNPEWDLPPIPLIQAIPFYMAWCVSHATEEGSLIFDYTISALNMYARAKDPALVWQNFRFHCDPTQTAAVLCFLYWCRDHLSVGYEPSLSRGIRNWEKLISS